MRKIISLFLVMSICISQIRPIYAVGFEDDASFNCFSVVKSFFSKKPDDENQQIDDNQQIKNIEELPNECLVHVLTYLGHAELSRLRYTDVFFKNLIDSESKFQFGITVPDLGYKHAKPMVKLHRKLEQLPQYEQTRDKNGSVKNNVYANYGEYGFESVKAYELNEQKKRWNKADCFGKMRYISTDGAFIYGSIVSAAFAIVGVIFYFNRGEIFYFNIPIASEKDLDLV